MAIVLAPAPRGFKGPLRPGDAHLVHVIAAELGRFDADCSAPIEFDLFFADALSRDAGVEIALKERHALGRWAIIAIDETAGGSMFRIEEQNVTTALEGWATESEPYGLFVSDIDGDRYSDLIAKEHLPPGRWLVALGRDIDSNEKNFEGPVRQFVPQGAPWLTGWAVDDAAYDLFSADVDGDRRADIIAKEKIAPGNWYVAKSDGAQFNPQPTWLTGWAVESSAYDFYVADVTADGRADVVAREKSGSGEWYVARSQGNKFNPQESPALGRANDPCDVSIRSGSDCNGNLR